nr:MAG TPA: transposase [Caudoviricetes sp.]
METINGTICISHAELTGRIITTANLNALVRKNQVKQMRKGGNGRTALYAVESLPLKWRTEVYKRYPDLQEQADSREFIDTVEPDGKALSFYQDYKLSDGRNLPDDKVLEYASNAAIMNAFRRRWEAHVSKRQRSGKRTTLAKEFWSRAAAALPRLADHFPHSLPGSPRRLQMKFAEYVSSGYECFISGKFLNGNAGKVLTDEQTGYLATLISNPNNVQDTVVAKFYNAKARMLGWKEITAAAVGVWREKLQLEAAAGRLGVTSFRANKTMQVKRSRPTAPFLMCSLDGWTVELLYQKTRTDKKGHNVTTYTNRLTIVVVLDPCVDYPMGYAVGDHECPELIKAALRNAAIHSREITGEMLRYNQVQSDRYAIKSMTELYAVLGDKVIPAQAHNAKAKPVEPYFNHLNTTYCQLCPNWSGFGVTTNPKRQPNSEALNKRRHSFPDEAGLRAQIDEMMRLERQQKIGKLMEKLANLKPEHRLPMSREMYLLNFGAETSFKNVLEGCGLRPTILGMKRDYDCFDLTFRDHASERWTVKYDPDDLHEVLAVSEDGTRRYMLEEKYVQPMALADRKPGDAEQLQRVHDYNKALEAETGRRLADHFEDARRVIERAAELPIHGTPALGACIEDRLLLTDSRGQHKDNRSRKRLAAADIEALEVETVEIPVTRQGDEVENVTVNDYSIF